MKKFFFFAIVFFFYFLPYQAQEIVVFKDDRALAVKSHHEKDGFVYMKVSEGELAVPKSQVKEIRKESSAAVKQPGFDTGRSFNPETQGVPPALSRKPLPRPGEASAPPVEDDDEDDESLEDDDEDDGDDLDDEDVEPRPKAPQRMPVAPGAAPGKTLRPLNPLNRKR